jgi:hypothetical protein
MKTLQFQIPDEIAARVEKLIQQRGADYESVNTSEIKGRDALLTDLVAVGLDEILAGETEFPDDV